MCTLEFFSSIGFYFSAVERCCEQRVQSHLLLFSMFVRCVQIYTTSKTTPNRLAENTQKPAQNLHREAKPRLEGACSILTHNMSKYMSKTLIPCADIMVLLVS